MKYLAALLVMVTCCGCGGGDVPKPNGKELQTLKGHDGVSIAWRSVQMASELSVVVGTRR